MTELETLADTGVTVIEYEFNKYVVVPITAVEYAT